VRVAAVGLNPADWELCRGFMAGSLPRGVGYDVAGTVISLGPGVDDIARGDVVFGTADFAGQPSAGVAEVALLDSWGPVPDGLEPVHAAVLPIVVQTAVWTLDAMVVEPGSTLVVNGGGASVGFAAVQIALARGARVIATAGPTFAADLIALGAQVTPYGEGVVDRVHALAGRPVDHVFDAARPTAGIIRDLIAIAGDPGRVMTISNHDEARKLGARVNLDHIANPVPAATILPEYASLSSRGAFRLPIARTYPRREWRDAVRLSTSGHPHGKIVLLPGEAADGAAAG
jgi:NADPH:quinone reductase-like Zn-dependent oxidoreductase